MEIIKKIFYILVTIIEIMLLAGMYIINYYTVKRMGMQRHVLHKNGVFEEQLNIVSLQYIAIAVFIVFMVLILAIYFKKKSSLKNIAKYMNIFMVILVLCFIVFELFCSTEVFRAYYYMSAMLGVATCIQIIKAFTGNFICKK